MSQLPLVQVRPEYCRPRQHPQVTQPPNHWTVVDGSIMGYAIRQPQHAATPTLRGPVPPPQLSPRRPVERWITPMIPRRPTLATRSPDPWQGGSFNPGTDSHCLHNMYILLYFVGVKVLSEEEEEWWRQGKGKGKGKGKAPIQQERGRQEEWRQEKRKRVQEEDKEDTTGEARKVDMVTAPLRLSPLRPSPLGHSPLRHSPLGPSLRMKKRKIFTKDQERLVAEHFTDYISRRAFPTSTECRDFLNLYPQFAGRNPKDIYDKCRNLAGR